MNPDEEEPKKEGEAAPEDARAEQAAVPDAPSENTEPQFEEIEAGAEPEVAPEEAPPAFEVEPVPAYEPPEPVYAEPEPPQPPAAEPPPRIHEVAAEILHEEPLAEIDRNYDAPQTQSAFDEEEYPFGEPEIPMPEPAPRASDRQRRRDAKRNLDLDLGRIKRRKRYGLFITSFNVLVHRLRARAGNVDACLFVL